jgi:hypothetical protein
VRNDGSRHCRSPDLQRASVSPWKVAMVAGFATPVGATECAKKILLALSVFSTDASKHQSVARVGVDDLMQ